MNKTQNENVITAMYSCDNGVVKLGSTNQENVVLLNSIADRYKIASALKQYNHNITLMCEVNDKIFNVHAIKDIDSNSFKTTMQSKDIINALNSLTDGEKMRYNPVIRYWHMQELHTIELLPY